MSEKSSCMAEAHTGQDTDLNTTCSPEANKENVKQPSTAGTGPRSAQNASSLLDAAQYVEAVMCSQQITTVLRTPIAENSSRKRHLSLPAIGESEVKKIRSDIANRYNEDSDCEENCESTIIRGNETKNENKQSSRNVVRARRNLLGKKDKDTKIAESIGKKGKNMTSSQRESIDTSRILQAMDELRCGLENKMDEISKNNNEKIEVMKNEMKTEIEKIRTDFNNRIEGLAKKVETKVSKALDKKLDDKTKVIKNNIDKEIQKIRTTNDKIVTSVTRVEETTLPTFKEELGDEIDELNRRMKDLEEKVSNGRKEDNDGSEPDSLKRSIIIRHLDERENENVKDIVNSLISSGLKLDKIRVESAIRKQSKNENKPGIVVAVCKSLNDKNSIMQKKRELRKSRRYENVYIEHHMAPEQRRLNNNLRAIVNTIGSDRLFLKGSRVLQNINNNNNNNNNNSNNNGGYERQTSYQRYGHSYNNTYRGNYDYRRNRDTYNTDCERNNYERRESRHS